MGFGLIGAGFIFLCNPNINIIDIMPDFIGLWLICAGLGKLAQINADVMDARGLFFKLSIVEVGKLAAIGLLNSQDPTWYLLLSFVFGVVECILFVFAIRSLFIGIENLGMRFSSNSVLATYTKKRRGEVLVRDVSTRVRVTITSFFFARTALAILPEFTELQDDTVISYRRIVYSEFKGIFYLIAMVIVIVYAVIFLRRTLKFWKSLKTDADFTGKLEKAYGDFLTINRNYRVSRVMKLVLVLYACAVALTYSPTDDGLIKVPLLFCASLLIIVSLLLTRVEKKAIFAAVPSAAVVILSIVDFIKQDRFYVDNTKFDDIFHIEEAMDKFSVISNLALIQYVLLLCVFIYLTRTIMMIGFSNIPMALSKNSLSLTPNDDEVAEIESKYNKYSSVITGLMAATVIIYGALTKLAIIAGEQSAFIDKNDINIPSIIFGWLSVGANALTVAWFAAVILFFGFARGRIYGCVYNWSVVSED